MGLFKKKKKNYINKNKPSKFKNKNDWDKLNAYCEQHDLDITEFED